MSTSKLVRSKLPCPNCPSSDAYHEYDDGHGYCFSCEYYHSPQESQTQNGQGYTYQYVPWREVTRETFEYFNSPSKIDSEGKPISIGFRYPNGHVKVRLFGKKDFYWVKSDSSEPTGLFGRNLFAAGSHKYVTITEGELDACSFWQSLPYSARHPVVSVRSSNNAVSDCTTDRSWLNSFERIYLAFDSDRQGREATAAVARLFDYGKVWDVKFSNRKDPNEYLAAHGPRQGGEELYNIWCNSRRYLPESLISSTEDFEKALKEEPKWGVPYPWPTLTEMTYGIRRGESVLLTAQEGIGKTELMHAIEYGLLRGTTDNIGSIFLEESQRRHLQALAGIHLAKPVHLPDAGCTSDQVIAALREVIPQDDRLYVYTHFGSDDPDVLLDTIRFLASARQCRYVLLDHISMVVSGLVAEDERRKLDYFSTKIEMMVKELDFALILVSHVNDFGQTRGSRYIGKIADIRIDAVRDVLADDESVRNTTNLSVSKNRYSGKTGYAGSLAFDQKTYTFTEIVNEKLLPDQRWSVPVATPVQGEGKKEKIQTSIPMAANDNTSERDKRAVA